MFESGRPRNGFCLVYDDCSTCSALSHSFNLVQNRIQQCLQHYMNKKEVINALIIQDNIEPHFTELVASLGAFWSSGPTVLNMVRRSLVSFVVNISTEQAEIVPIDDSMAANNRHGNPLFTESSRKQFVANEWRLEEENQEFFQGILYEVIGEAPNNGIQQVAFTTGGADASNRIKWDSSYVHIKWITYFTISAYLHILCCTKCQNSENRGHSAGKRVSKLQTSSPIVSTRNRQRIVKTEGGYAGSSPFDFSPPSNYLESRPLMGDASVSSFSSVDSNAQHLNDAILDGDTSSFGFLPQIPQSFGLPDLTADFTNLLESYCRPPFLATDGNNFMDPHGNVERLEDPESESLRYQCFGGHDPINAQRMDPCLSKRQGSAQQGSHHGECMDWAKENVRLEFLNLFIQHSDVSPL
ncbi:hypothetical protein Sango_0444900 [Sesamum angolense]|uniref:Uncharacterized protein n=1 Tax=Sesamum angolense TaxID=2727404 RepID=A0AAE1XBF9_9LAMI|nr:hypothetical protein Sango_0444900 [Sesamum angolense]